MPTQKLAPSYQARVFKAMCKLVKLQLSRITPENIAKQRTRVNRLVAIVTELDKTIPEAELLHVGGVPAELVHPKTGPRREGMVLYLHGGAYIMMNPMVYRPLVGILANSVGVPVLTIDYRLAPEHVFPAPIEDAQRAYKWMLHDRKINPRQIAFAGDSSGGNLTVASLLAAQTAGLPRPAAAVCFSPWLDLTHTGATMQTNAKRDALLPADKCPTAATVYAGGSPLTTPLVSPLYASPSALAQLPPTLVHVGTEEILLDDSLRFGQKCKDAGAPVSVKVWPHMQHVFQFGGPAIKMPEALQSLAEAADFISAHLKQ